MWKASGRRGDHQCGGVSVVGSGRLKLPLESQVKSMTFDHFTSCLDILCNLVMVLLRRGDGCGVFP